VGPAGDVHLLPSDHVGGEPRASVEHELRCLVHFVGVDVLELFRTYNSEIASVAYGFDIHHGFVGEDKRLKEGFWVMGMATTDDVRYSSDFTTKNGTKKRGFSMEKKVKNSGFIAIPESQKTSGNGRLMNNV